jgi:hypothetical protein
LVSAVKQHHAVFEVATKIVRSKDEKCPLDVIVVHHIAISKLHWLNGQNQAQTNFFPFGRLPVRIVGKRCPGTVVKNAHNHEISMNMIGLSSRIRRQLDLLE